MSTQSSHQTWGGRFAEGPDARVAAFTESISFETRLAPYDIRGSIAHARMLSTIGVLSADEFGEIEAGLKAIEARIAAGDFPWDAALEDVHMNIEARLTDDIGALGKKLHTARSRNDQVATDVRLWLRDTLDALIDEVKRLRAGLIELAEREADTIMPGFTHMQVAQPVTFGHHMLAWQAMLARDSERLAQIRARANVLPLGAAALAGTTFAIDREMVAQELGFDGVIDNSLDAVSDRDFAIEFVSAAATIMMHLSRFSEELILWMSPAFDFVELPDRYCTGSSIMPQKKNPDVAELTRGKTARVQGHLTALLTLMKGQPLAYNRDNQEDKVPMFDTADTVGACVALFADMAPHIMVKREQCREAARRGFATATDLADYLVRAGVAFRDAHEIVGNCVSRAIREGCDLAELELTTLREYSDAIGEDVYEVLTLEGSVAARNHIGGTAPDQVRAAAARARHALES
ncbi:argininosuccinate lyase [Salinisphaera hydrothermalis]|uniref:Argininosuccinate lyase n=1 Tax=Salinisphaera hydrothermalis (strain C41B8) TaxID=1304275 RepID=A0A084IN23_SALHC|nr:argininosuccinate lyase [Salinisphaera hydrothermalis]KEZ78107.1 argininosuccinate lyase [Salinisphaera hydrothermalis C41B8]